LTISSTAPAVTTPLLSVDASASALTNTAHLYHLTAAVPSLAGAAAVTLLSVATGHGSSLTVLGNGVTAAPRGVVVESTTAQVDASLTVGGAFAVRQAAAVVDSARS
jgi:hypothetical protein